ncbi:Predicted polyphosphate-or ATP-dependent NAD kinase [Nitrosomonas marina]|uniref:Predicted polyphosphate-or ATP-dependent NAD kinase n=1 Tax=Nitrosomonas marina TaxID=917 RepID=A0A1I0EKI5_9PROT|nr:ATP-NAD kinase family protein [Nitrosomonas marina]SET45968.1 Predicted polyphosphate-or ATP-dependent NAD kinase [Nitrosomonas marina]
MCDKKCVGFLINPIAGMGGRVGLKGTDGMENQARALGARPAAHLRAMDALCRFVQLMSHATAFPLRWLTCSGEMGEAVLKTAGIPMNVIEIVHIVTGQSTAEDTRRAVSSFMAQKVDLIVFCGGDGTARDICSVAGNGVPILGIPSGVKMFSGVFAINPVRCAETMLAFLQDRLTAVQTEVLDLDEASYRAGEWKVKLYHAALTPFEPRYMQSSKALIEDVDDTAVRAGIADYLLEQFQHETPALVFLGAGSTVKSVGDRWGIDKTLLGVDAVVNGECIGSDLNEQQILELLGRFKARKLILSPIGAQGFVLGRGNSQLSPAVIREIGCNNIIVIATPAKLAKTPVLRFDTGDAMLDRELADDGYIRVVTGYRRRTLVKTML